MNIAYIHSDKKIWTGAHYINDLMASKLKNSGIIVNNFYPQFALNDLPIHFKGVNNILFFYSLLEKRKQILKNDIIQGTTYTPVAFMNFSKPVVTHFGSTTKGFLDAVPKYKTLEKETIKILHQLKKDWVVNELHLKTRRPLRDIATIEHYAARKCTAVIATSDIVKKNLISAGIDKNKIVIIHNMIEDYRFEAAQHKFLEEPRLFFLWRIGEDVFTLKLKWVMRLIYIYLKFPKLKKVSIIMTYSKKLINWLQNKIPNHQVEANIIKDEIPQKLANCLGWILLITSRYEGFSLSLIEGMSQWLVPICFRVWVAPEIIKNWENGYLVDSLNEVIDIIKNLSQDNLLRKKLWERSMETSKRFMSTAITLKLTDFYSTLV